jgi:hypothetical protein
MTSPIITSLAVDDVDQRCISEGVPSGRQCFELGLGIVVKRHRLEAVIACPAVPQIGYAARTVFNPLGGGDRRAALRAGILFGQTAEIQSRHGASPFAFFLSLTNWTGLLADKVPLSCRLSLCTSNLSFERQNHHPAMTSIRTHLLKAYFAFASTAGSIVCSASCFAVNGATPLAIS